MQHAPTTDVSHPNRQALLRLYDAFAQGDMDTAMATLTEDIEWHVNGAAPVAGTYRGKEAVLEFFGRMMAQYNGTLNVAVTATVADDQHGFVRVAEHAESPRGGVAYRGIHLSQFRDGKCARFESCYDDAYTDFWSAQLTPSEQATV